MKLVRRLMPVLAAILTLALLSGCTSHKSAVVTATVAPHASAPVTTPADPQNSAAQNTESPRDTGSGQDNGMIREGSDAPDGDTATQNASGQDTPKPVDWLKDFLNVETRLNMISEISSSCVLVDGDVALVGVSFDEAYQGEMTQRIRDMVAGEVQAADPALQTVGVTAEEADVSKIQELAEQVRSGNQPADLSDQMNAILNNPTTITGG